MTGKIQRAGTGYAWFPMTPDQKHFRRYHFRFFQIIKKKTPPFQLNPTHQPWALLRRKLAAFPVSLQHCCEKASSGEIRLAHGAIRSITTLSRHICETMLHIYSLFMCQQMALYIYYVYICHVYQKKKRCFFLGNNSSRSHVLKQHPLVGSPVFCLLLSADLSSLGTQADQIC